MELRTTRNLLLLGALGLAACEAPDPVPSATDAAGTYASTTDGGEVDDTTTTGGESGDAPDADTGTSSTDTGSGPMLEGPCPAYPEPCRILPMGDSITFGMRATPDGPTSSGGYRRYLRKALLEANKSFEYLGSCPGFEGNCRIPPDGNPPYCFAGGSPELGRHDGHPGWDINAFRVRDDGACPGSIETFLSRLTNDADEHVMPHIVLLMVGANDVRAGAGIREGASMRFEYLIDELLAALPSETLLVVGTVTPNLNGTNNPDGVIPFNQDLTAVIEARQQAGHNVMQVDTYGAIRINANGGSPDLSSDKLHPNEQGYQRIAQVWHETIGPLVRDP